MLSIWAKYTSGPEKLPLDASGLNLCSQFRISQPECVANDGYGTQAHRRARDDGTKEQAEKWVEQTCRDRNSQRVIDEREEKILPDVSHHRTAQVYGLGYAKQVAFHDRNSRAFHRHGHKLEPFDDAKHPAESFLRVRLQCAWNSYRGRIALSILRLAPESRHRGRGDELEFRIRHW